MSLDKIVLVHLSDIHFHRKLSNTHLDLDKDLRNQLEIDIERMHKQLGLITGIVVTGDIAFAGHKDEYQIANEWLQILCDKSGCSLEDVWMVPGNHDIDRNTIDRSMGLEDCHQRLRQVDINELDHLLSRYFMDEAAGVTLFEPLKNYNEFARQFECHVNADRLYWEDDLELNDGSILRLRGLNSTIISDKYDNDTTHKLVLGTLQATPPTQDGVEYLTLCHHPLQWLRDQEAIEPYLDSRVRLQLYGHKHKQKIDQAEKTIRITAGATHPERREPNWLPRYNVLEIWVVGENSNRQLKIAIHPRSWSIEDKKFVAEYRDDLPFRKYSFDLDSWSAPTKNTDIISIEVNKTPASNIQPIASPVTSEVKPSKSGERPMNRARRLTYRFYTLAYNVRLKVAQDLNLLKDEDKDVPDTELFSRFYNRAQENKQLEQLWESVESAHGDNRFPVNPFIGE